MLLLVSSEYGLKLEYFVNIPYVIPSSTNSTKSMIIVLRFDTLDQKKAGLSPPLTLNYKSFTIRQVNSQSWTRI